MATVFTYPEMKAFLEWYGIYTETFQSHLENKMGNITLLELIEDDAEGNYQYWFIFDGIDIAQKLPRDVFEREIGNIDHHIQAYTQEIEAEHYPSPFEELLYSDNDKIRMMRALENLMGKKIGE